MDKSNTRKVRIALLVTVIAVLCGALVAAQTVTTGPGTTTTPAYDTPFTSGFCGGVITSTPVVGGTSSTAATNNVIIITVLIMAAVVAALGFIYMISFALNNIGNLRDLVKTEFVETIGTAIILVLFFGGFLSIGTLVTSGNGQSFAGPGRAIFLSDCEQVTTTSLNLIPPLLTIGTENWLLSTIISVNVKLQPDGFGFTTSPLSGLSVYTNSLEILSGFTSGLLLLTLSVAFFLGLIYALFPILLYVGIVLRAFPWTRAAGGTLIAVFLGFYVFFPLILFTTLGSFSSATAYNTGVYATCNTGGPTAVGQFLTGDSTYVPSTWLTYWPNSLLNFFGAGNSSSCGYGLINGYIHYFVEPPGITLFTLVLTFIVSFDFADLLADLLGAPSLSSGNLSSFLRKWV